jgi:hypothetical protein
MVLLTTGDENIGIGYTALQRITSAEHNVAIGHVAQNQNQTGSDNTAIGNSAMSGNDSGSDNTAVGSFALDNGSSNNSTAVGYAALGSASQQGSVKNENTALGYKAGDVIQRGRYNVIIGASSDPSATDTDNEIVIGYEATGQGANYAVIGNADITRLYAAQDGAAVLYANGTIQSSDRRIKKEINDLAYGISFIKRLRPVSYYKLNPNNYPQELKDKFYPNGKVREVSSEDYDKLQVGFIAQEVKALNEELGAENNIVNVDDDGFHRMDYEKIVVPLVKAVQEQQDQIEALQAQINSLLAVNQERTQNETTEGDEQ